MMPHQDSTLLALIRCHVEDGGPLEPIVDRCIEMGHHTAIIDPYFNSILWRMPEIDRLFRRVVYQIDWALRQLGHDDLADMIPF